MYAQVINPWHQTSNETSGSDVYRIFMPNRPVISDNGMIMVATPDNCFMSSLTVLDASLTSMDTLDKYVFCNDPNSSLASSNCCNMVTT